MYLAWKYHHIPPSVYFNFGYGEKAIVSAFIEQEAEDNKRENED